MPLNTKQTNNLCQPAETHWDLPFLYPLYGERALLPFYVGSPTPFPNVPLYRLVASIWVSYYCCAVTLVLLEVWDELLGHKYRGDARDKSTSQLSTTDKRQAQLFKILQQCYNGVYIYFRHKVHSTL